MAYTTSLMCFSYSCSTQQEEVINDLANSSMVLMPESSLYELQNLNDVTFPLFFNIKNKDTKFGYVCGVKSFTSPPGVCHVPYYIMQQIGVSEGENVDIELINPPEGSYIKIRPHKTEFINLTNPKALLEHVLSRNYPVVTQGHTISIYYEALKKNFLIDIVETKPSSVIQIIDKNINLDFDKPLDYVEPPKPKPEPRQAFSESKHENKKIVTPNRELNNYKKTGGFVAFSGKGYRLGSS